MVRLLPEVPESVLDISFFSMLGDAMVTVASSS